MTTDRLGMALPPDGNTDWGSDIRGNFRTLDRALGGHNFAEDPDNHSGLNFAHKAGRYYQGGESILIEAGSVLLEDDTTQTIVLDTEAEDLDVIEDYDGELESGQFELFHVTTAGGQIVAVEDLRAFLRVGGGGDGVQWDLLADETLDQDGDEWDITGISSDYNVLRFRLEWSAPSGSNFPGIRLNGDAGTNYARQSSAWSGSTSGSHAQQHREEFPLMRNSISGGEPCVTQGVIYKPVAGERALIVAKSLKGSGSDVEHHISIGEWQEETEKIDRFQLFGGSGDLSAGSRLILEGTEVDDPWLLWP